MTDLFIVCTAPYGYRMVDKKNLEVIPEEAAVVRWIFSSYLKGRSMRWIAEVLIAKGISPHREPGLWTEVGIRYILTNTLSVRSHTPAASRLFGRKTAESKCVSTFCLSKFFTSSGINLCPGSRIAFLTTLCHCVDAGYAQDKKQEETNMTIDSAKDLQMKGS